MKTRNLLYTTLSLFLVLGCKSVDKLVDQGKYDDAIILATKKLAGKENKKTKHVLALEEAFLKVNQRDLARIETLSASSDPIKWENIYHYANQVKDRQNHLSSFLPLTSKNGYTARFAFTNMDEILSESAENAAAHLYNQGNILLEKALAAGNKKFAQEANNLFVQTKNYISTYKDVNDLIDKSRDLGTYHVLVQADDETLAFETWSKIRGDQNWIEYHTEFSDEVFFDAVSTLAIEEVIISPEREQINTVTESRTISTNDVLVSVNGNIGPDSLGSDIRELTKETINAYVTEISRSKDVRVSLSVQTVDFNNGHLLTRDRFNYTIDFKSDGFTFTGDERALSHNFRRKVNQILLPFPLDNEMIDKALAQGVTDLAQHIRDIDVTDLNENASGLR